MTDLADVKAVGGAIGQPIERLEDERLLQGQGQYAGDLQREHMLHAAIFRSSIPHGLIHKIDFQKAKTMPGVHAVITAADIVPMRRIPLRQDAVDSVEPFFQPVIAHEKVRYVGEPLAVAVADTPARALDAAEAITADIEALPPVTDAAAGQCALTVTAIKGDADAAFRNAPYTRKERFRTNRHTAMPMETRGLLAEWDPAGRRLTLGSPIDWQQISQA